MNHFVFNAVLTLNKNARICDTISGMFFINDLNKMTEIHHEGFKDDHADIALFDYLSTLNFR